MILELKMIKIMSGVIRNPCKSFAYILIFILASVIFGAVMDYVEFTKLKEEIPAGETETWRVLDRVLKFQTLKHKH